MYTEKSVRELEKLFTTSLQDGLKEDVAKVRLLENGENRILEGKGNRFCSSFLSSCAIL